MLSERPQEQFMTKLAAGRVLGRYRVIAPLGRGGMAAVYRAEESSLGREVALKVLPAELMDQPGFLERFEREAQLIAQLEHPNIVPLYASGIDEGIPWMALRLLGHGTLQERLELGELGTEEGLQLFAQVAKALDHAHAQGVLHRDLKPQNVLLGTDGSAYLADFGIARILSGNSELTGTGMMLGTPSYMAPEQALGQELGPACDFYALAVMLYRWLCGEVPFGADTPMAVMMKHVQAPVPLEPMDSLAPAVRDVLLIGLAKDPGQRWPSAVAMVQALDQALRADAAPTAIQKRGFSPTIPPTSTDLTTRRSRRPLWLGLAALPLLLGLVFAGIVYWPGEVADSEEARVTLPDRERRTEVAGYGEDVRDVDRAEVSVEDGADDSIDDSEEVARGAPVEALAFLDVPDGRAEDSPAADEPMGQQPEPEPETDDTPLVSTEVDPTPSAAEPAEPTAEPARTEQAERTASRLAAPEVEEPSPRAASTERLIRDIQSELRRLGRNVPDSGSIDEATRTEIRAFEAARGHPETGIASAGLLDAMKAATTWPPPPPGTVFRDCPQCPEMVVIPAGRFMMGSPADEPQRKSTEGPQREVSINTFAMAVFETRFAEWDICLAEGGCTHRPNDRGWGGGSQPVIDVSWNDAQEFVAWLSDHTGHRYRLPSEAEWEYAARGGTTGRHYLGDCFSSDQANYNARHPARGCPRGEYRRQPVAVGSFPANPYGLHDMHGNVWQWIQDCANSNYRDAPVDGSAWMRGNCNRGIVRGGAWHDWGLWLRASARYSFPRHSRHAVGGFRVVRELP
ncbi:MAG: hypothetical protein EA370_04720 [Wenzhouxiangella sp.]|nr:MAG: hypothetical protein EA370_04720 [Wenzhouxiangella sp.]